MGKNFNKTIKEKFNIQTVINKYINILEDEI